MRQLQDIGSNIAQWASSPAVLRPVGDLMRAVSPVAKVGNNVFVFNYPDVISTLSSEVDFGVTPAYATKMDETSGAFFLGMEDGPRYYREHGFARAGFREGDMERISKLMGEYAKESVERVARTGEMDLVGDFAYHLPLRLLADYFGVPGPSPEILQRWMQSLFWQLFLNFGNDETVRDQALQSSREMRPYLAQRVAELRAKPDDATFLGRLVAELVANPVPGLDDDAVVRNIGGIIIGAVSTQATSMSLALQELLRRPDELARAQIAARENDDAAVSGYVFEALRFNPHNPLVIRHVMRETVLGEGMLHQRRVVPGDRVFAMTISASFDARGFPDPERFDPNRPYSSYLHFGYGLHRCFGAQIVHAVLTASLKEVLKLEALRSVKAPSRAILRDGPFPRKFDLRFKPIARASGAAPRTKRGARVAA